MFLLISSPRSIEGVSNVGFGTVNHQRSGVDDGKDSHPARRDTDQRTYILIDATRMDEAQTLRNNNR